MTMIIVAVFSMFFVSMIIVAVFGMFFVSMIIVAVFSMFFMSVVIVTSLRMRLVIMFVESAPFPERQSDQAMCVNQFNDPCFRRECLKRFFKKRFQFMANPKNHISALEFLRLRRLQSIIVRRPSALYNQVGLTDALHDRGNE